MKQKLYALDAFFIEKLKLSENDPVVIHRIISIYKHYKQTLYTEITHFITDIWSIIQVMHTNAYFLSSLSIDLFVYLSITQKDGLFLRKL